jgi:hypothetical protein
VDLLAEIKQKASKLSGHAVSTGIEAVVRHIERAEQHILRARNDGENDAFNDAIYRTNQAFEGALKEAFGVLVASGSANVAVHVIEQHLLQNDILAPRVADLLTNYRRQWRNPSAHDHRLLFRDQEAFLAIVSVSAFVSVLVDQMIEAVNRQYERMHAERAQAQIRDGLGSYADLPFDEQVVKLVLAFNESLARNSATKLNDIEILGRLTGFINSVDPQIGLRREPTLQDGDIVLRPDLLLTKQDSTVVLEFCRLRPYHFELTAARQQLLVYLLAGGWKYGVIFAPSVEGYTELRTETLQWNIIDNKPRIHELVAID